MAEINQEVTYNISEQKDKFIIPERVRQTLGMGDDHELPLRLTITHSETGDILVEDVIVNYITEDWEIMEPKSRAVLESHDNLRVTLSRVE